MSGVQTTAEACAELQQWYEARKAATAGQSITIVTSAGTRTVTSQDLEDIQSIIEQLERKCNGVPDDQQGLHNFALANFNNEAQR